MRYKRQLIILLFSVILYIAFGAIYNKFVVKTNEQKIYVINNSIKKGNVIKKEELSQFTVKVKEKEEKFELDIANIENQVANFDLSNGQILTKDLLVPKEEYVLNGKQKDKEVIAIKIKSSEDSVSYNVSKDSIVNIYYTGKTEFANEILKNVDKSTVISGGSTGYISTKLLSSIKILGLYDKYGNEITVNKLNKDNEIAIDTAIIEVDEKMAMIVANLSEYGDFSFSLVE